MKFSVYESLIEKKSPIAVIGLGYVGLPIALAFAKKIKVLVLMLIIKNIIWHIINS